MATLKNVGVMIVTDEPLQLDYGICMTACNTSVSNRSSTKNS